MLSSVRKMYEIYYFMKKITLIIMEGAQFDQSTSADSIKLFSGVVCLV